MDKIELTLTQSTFDHGWYCIVNNIDKSIKLSIDYSEIQNDTYQEKDRQNEKDNAFTKFIKTSKEFGATMEEINNIQYNDHTGEYKILIH